MTFGCTSRTNVVPNNAGTLSRGFTNNNQSFQTCNVAFGSRSWWFFGKANCGYLFTDFCRTFKLQNCDVVFQVLHGKTFVSIKSLYFKLFLDISWTSLLSVST